MNIFERERFALEWREFRKHSKMADFHHSLTHIASHLFALGAVTAGQLLSRDVLDEVGIAVTRSNGIDSLLIGPDELLVTCQLFATRFYTEWFKLTSVEKTIDELKSNLNPMLPSMTGDKLQWFTLRVGIMGALAATSDQFAQTSLQAVLDVVQGEKDARSDDEVRDAIRELVKRRYNRINFAHRNKDGAPINIYRAYDK